jgi:hypothetical protein
VRILANLDCFAESALRARFFSKTRLEEVERKPGLGPCRVWTGAKRNGYGHFAMPGKRQVYAHRLAFELVARRAPRKGFDVRHRCDHRPCVLSDHLVEGTRLENVADAVAQGRHAHGERHGLARLTDEQVREIRKRRLGGERVRTVAADFGITQSMVSQIALGTRRRSA